MDNIHAVEFKNITKTFGPKVVANKNVDLYVDKGIIMSLLGENGSGKTTLMNMLAGIYYQDEGQILINGEVADIKSPRDAYKYGVGMIHQHFKLVDVFTATENIVLGLKEKDKFDIKNSSKKVKEIADKYGFEIDLEKKIYDMSVSEKQTVEILKVLYRGADILILDEPTAVLTPQETRKLFEVIRAMKNDNKTIILITHKLNEVKEISDVVAILRKGEHIKTVHTSEVTPQELTEMMVGRKVELNINRSEPINPKPRLTVKNLNVVDMDGVKKLDDVSFVANSNEILGIAGIAGSGQKELLETIAGLVKPTEGSIIYSPESKEAEELVGKTPMEIKEAGVALAFVPEDRLGMGLVGDMGMTDNVFLRYWNKNKKVVLNKEESKNIAQDIYENLEVVTPSIEYPVRRLSGGNVQKVLVGREIASSPSVLMSAYAVRGLDINTSYVIYDLMNKQKEKGVAVIFVGEDLDILLALSDRILVLCDGKVAGIVDARSADKELLGRLMIGDTERKLDHE